MRYAPFVLLDLELQRVKHSIVEKIAHRNVKPVQQLFHGGDRQLPARRQHEAVDGRGRDAGACCELIYRDMLLSAE